MNCRLPCRIRAPYYIDGFSFAGERFACTAPIVNACALQAVHAGHIEPSPLHTGGDHQGMAGYLSAVCKFHIAIWPLQADADCFLRGEDLHSKSLRLYYSPASEIRDA